MNPPPNGKWSYWHESDGMNYRYYWNGSDYVYAGDIVSGQDQVFMSNPDYVNDIGKSDIDITQLSGVEVIGKIKKIFSSETYNTPAKQKNAVFVIVAIAAVTFLLLVYFKKIKF